MPDLALKFVDIMSKFAFVPTFTHFQITYWPYPEPALYFSVYLQCPHLRHWRIPITFVIPQLCSFPSSHSSNIFFFIYLHLYFAFSWQITLDMFVTSFVGELPFQPRNPQDPDSAGVLPISRISIKRFDLSCFSHGNIFFRAPIAGFISFSCFLVFRTPIFSRHFRYLIYFSLVVRLNGLLSFVVQ